MIAAATPRGPEAPATTGTSSRRAALLLVALTLAGLALRLHRLDWQGLWHDEAGSVTVARATAGEFLAFFVHRRQPFELNPPVYFLLLRAWASVLGTHDYAVRLFSALAGTATVPLAAALGTRLFDRRAGLCAAALAAVSQLGVMFSQEVRGYALVAPLWLLTCYWFLAARDRRCSRDWGLATVAAILMVGTHYYAALAVGALAIYVLLAWREIPLHWPAVSLAAAGATLGPWIRLTLPAQLQQARAAAVHAYYAVQPAAPLTLVNRLNNGAFAGLLAPAPHWAFAVGGLLFSLPIAALMLSGWQGSDERERDGVLFLVLATGAPALGGIAAAWLAHVQYDIRFVAFVAAPYAVLAGAALTRFPLRALRPWLIGAALTYSLLALRVNYTMPYKEDYRGAIRFVDARAQSDDCLAFAPFGVAPLQWPLYTTRPVDRLLTPDSPPASVAACRRIWLFTYARVEVSTMGRWDEWLERLHRDFREADTASFWWVRADRLDRRKTNVSGH